VRLSLEDPWKRAVALVAASLLIFVYGFWCVQEWRAQRYSRSNDPAQIQKSAQLEPGNADYLHLLGLQQLFIEQDAAAATNAFQQAIALNPADARYWLSLATAAQQTGNVTLQRHAIDQAAAVDPTTPTTAWDVGNFYLYAGDVHAALRSFRVVLASSPWQWDTTLNMCWRMTKDADLILREGVPPIPGVYYDFIQILQSKQEYAEAAKVWDALLALHQPVDAAAALPYIDGLLARNDVGEAERAWRQLVVAIPALGRYIEPDNLLVNGSFDEPLLNAGFDWRFPTSGRFATGLDSSQMHGGSRSLMVRFAGEPAGEIVDQLVPVDPGTEYRLAAFVRTEEIYTADSPRLIVEDAANGNRLLVTAEEVGTSSWHEVAGSFKTLPATRLIRVKLAQSAATAHIRGSLWIDDVRLTRQ